MVVQPVVAEMLPGGQGYRVRFLPPWTDWPSDDAVADARRMNRWIESEIRAQPGAVPVGAQAFQDAAAGRAVALRLMRVPRPIIAPMRLKFTKMQGAGNDFVVLDAHARAARADARAGARAWPTAASASAPTRSWWSSRSRTPGVDFRYRIFNSSGDEVEHCGNGARCFVRYVHEHGLTDKTHASASRPSTTCSSCGCSDDGRVTVDMNRAGVRARAHALRRQRPGAAARGRLRAVAAGAGRRRRRGGRAVDGQPACGAARGRRRHRAGGRARPARSRRTRAFRASVNAGFMQVLSPRRTSACACTSAAPARRWPAAPAPAPRWWPASGWAGWTARVEVRHARRRACSSSGRPTSASVLMTGPAETVFEGEIEL